MRTNNTVKKKDKLIINTSLKFINNVNNVNRKSSSLVSALGLRRPDEQTGSIPLVTLWTYFIRDSNYRRWLGGIGWNWETFDIYMHYLMISTIYN